MRVLYRIQYGLLVVILVLSSGSSQAGADDNGGGVEQERPLGAVKISCVERGVHRVWGGQLAELGIRLRDIEPERMALVHQNESIPFWFSDEGNGKFDPADSIFFHAEGLKAEQEPYINILRDYTPRSQSFMLRLDPSPYRPKRYQRAAREAPGIDDLAEFPLGEAQGRLRFEKDLVWEFVNERVEKRKRDQDDLKVDYLFWKKLTYPNSNKTKNTITVPFDLPEIIDAVQAAIHVRLVGVSDVKSYRRDVEHNVTVRVNGQLTRSISWSRPQRHTARIDVPARVLRAGPNRLELTIEPPARITGSGSGRWVSLDVVMLDWFEVRYAQITKVHDGRGEFYVNEEEDEEEWPLTIRGFRGPWGLAFDLEEQEVFTAGSFKEEDSDTHGMNLRVKPGRKRLVVLETPEAHEPFSMERVFPRGLFERPVDCDMLILTHEKFRSTLVPFIEWKQQRGLKVHTVDIADIYNERTAGYATCQALRDYIEHVYRSQPEPKLKYVLLVGDSRLVSKYQTYLPAYSFRHSGQAADDNFYANFRGAEWLPVVAVGRFSVTSEWQLKYIVNKVIAYESGKSGGHWRSRFHVIVAAESWANNYADDLIEEFLHPHYLVDLVQTKPSDASADSHRRITESIVDQFNAGSLITTFFGHGGGTVWEVGPARGQGSFQAHLFDQWHVKRLQNHDHLPLVFALTCYTNKFDDPHVSQTLGETFVNSRGGAIAVIGASRRTHPTLGSMFMEAMMRTLTENRFPRLGDHFVNAKREVKRTLDYVLLGDPSLEFRVPPSDLAITNARWDAARGTLRLDYHLPPDASLPAELRISAVDRNETVLGEWTYSIDQPQGDLECELDAARPGRAGPRRIVAHLADADNQAHAGGVILADPPQEKQTARSY